jgi:Ca2+-dependent lipid-binding protein
LLDPFFDITVLGENHKPIKLYRSEVIKSTLNPDWKSFELPWQPVGGLDSPIKVSVYDWDKTGGHDVSFAVFPQFYLLVTFLL